ncbi:MAG: ATP-dependent zinc metalloprotease FtsH [Lachnospiraceae bacterium]|nr:ATP-dependent zinc metalloprotease FtsH [Lachnospiraceae bacterium]
MDEKNNYNNYNGYGGGDPGSGYNRGNGNGGNNGGNGGPGRDPRNRQTIYILIIATLITLLGMSFMTKAVSKSTTQEIPYSQFLKMLEEDQIAEVEITEDQINITPKSEDGTASLLMTYYTGIVDDPDLVTRLEKAGIDYSHTIPDRSSWIISTIVNFVLPLVLVWGLLSLFMRRMGSSGGGILGVGRSASKAYVTKDTGVSFKDVAGQEEAKESLQEMVDFLHNPQKYVHIGARLPKGALLVGPPGTGKTLLARAVAGEAHVPFYSLAGSDFVEMFVGVGASRVRDLFSDAEKNAPCIIFIDEIDAIGKSRDSRYGGGNDEREQTLNQLLSEMDGFDSSKGILVIGATNRPETLDKALLRPGRFDRRVIVDKPDLKGRIDTLKVHAKDVKLDESVDFEAVALATSGAVGSDLANMVNEAAINAVKSGRQYVNQKDLMDSVEVVLVGKEKKDRIMSKEERRIVSYHEIGHALVSALQKNSEPVQKITIVPRTMGALGYVMNVPEEEKYLNTEAELHALLVETLGGRAAEEIVFDTVTTGAANDIEKATKTARAMVTQYGMSKKFGLMGLETIQDQYLEGRTVMNCSDETAAAVDEEVMKILKEAYKEAKSLLKENRALLDKLAQFLIEKETITGKEFMKIYREEKGLTEEDTSGRGKERISMKGVSKSKKKNGSKEEDFRETMPEEPTSHTFEVEVNDNTPARGDQEYPFSGDAYAGSGSKDESIYEGMGAVVRGRKNDNRGTDNE